MSQRARIHARYNDRRVTPNAEPKSGIRIARSLQLYTSWYRPMMFGWENSNRS